MSVFDDPASLRGQSFGYGLASLDATAEDLEEFVETSQLAVFVDEKAKVHISGPLKLYAPTDPIDCDEEPTFSKGNRFIRGVSKVIPAVPAYGIILWDLRDGRGGVSRSIPPGWAECNGEIYKLPGGEKWAVPVIDASLGGPGSALAYIQKLPEGAEYFDGGTEFPRFGLAS